MKHITGSWNVLGFLIGTALIAGKLFAKSYSFLIAPVMILANFIGKHYRDEIDQGAKHVRNFFKNLRKEPCKP